MSPLRHCSQTTSTSVRFLADKSTPYLAVDVGWFGGCYVWLLCVYLHTRPCAPFVFFFWRLPGHQPLIAWRNPFCMSWAVFCYASSAMQGQWLIRIHQLLFQRSNQINCNYSCSVFSWFSILHGLWIGLFFINCCIGFGMKMSTIWKTLVSKRII